MKWVYYFLFFLVPLILTPLNYELFEFNKMLLVYILAAAALIFSLTKSFIQQRSIFHRTPLDIPIFLYLSSHILSSITSIDLHVSLYGYYSRFNEGLLATISYIILYYCLVANFSWKEVLKFLKISFLSALLVSLY